MIEDHTRVWWDIRPHPRLGTLEIRIADQPTALERTALIVGVLRDARRARRRRGAPTAATTSRTASRRRVAASTPSSSIRTATALVSARELARELLGAEPPEPEAFAQLAAADVAADLVARTVA